MLSYVCRPGAPKTSSPKGGGVSLAHSRPPNSIASCRIRKLADSGDACPSLKLCRVPGFWSLHLSRGLNNDPNSARLRIRQYLPVLGKSGTTAQGWDDFHQLMAAVGLGAVGWSSPWKPRPTPPRVAEGGSRPMTTVPDVCSPSAASPRRVNQSACARRRLRPGARSGGRAAEGNFQGDRGERRGDPGGGRA
jgi:hypothetical protein